MFYFSMFSSIMAVAILFILFVCFTKYYFNDPHQLAVDLWSVLQMFIYNHF
jgi:hypothetical protein